MSLVGNAVLAIWNDILPEARSAFIEWHNREHIPERVAIPGFRRGRRHIARYGTPQYFTLYEADDEAVLVGPDYLERLNNPTPWTREVTQAFQNTIRGICSTVYSSGCADGGTIATLRFDAAPDCASQLRQHLLETLPKIAPLAGVVGVHLCVSDQSASSIPTTESRGRTIGMPGWIIMIEAISQAASDQAADALLSDNLALHGASPEIHRGVYVLEATHMNLPRASP